MAKTDTFQCSVITPERIVLDTPARFVAFPAHDGEVGVLPHRAPLVYKLGIGVLRVQTLEETQVFFIDGGFAQMTGNRLSILTEQAKKATEIQPPAAEKALNEARAMGSTDDQSHTAKEKAIRRAKTQLKLSRQHP